VERFLCSTVPPASLLLLGDPAAASHNLLCKHLRAVGHQLYPCPDHSSLLDALRRHPIDLVVMTDEPGLAALCDLCTELITLRPLLQTLVLLRSDAYSDRVQLLRAGADDVLSQPYALEELLARVEALLRRRPGLDLHVDEFHPTLLRHRDLSINTDQRLVLRAGVPVRLTVKEYDLLLYLLQHQGVVLPRLEILKAVWGPTWVGDDNLLDVYIRYLRKKIERPELEPLVHTVRGVGFMLD